MTAAQLNRAHAAYCTNPKPGTLSDLLQAVREHSLAKYHRDGELAEDIAQAIQLKVWRSVDPAAHKPLQPFVPNGPASFSTWLSRASGSVRTDCWRTREKNQRTQHRNEEEPAELVYTTAKAVERAHYALTDPWQSKGRRRTVKTPEENFYYEGRH